MATSQLNNRPIKSVFLGLIAGAFLAVVLNLTLNNYKADFSLTAWAIQGITLCTFTGTGLFAGLLNFFWPKLTSWCSRDVTSAVGQTQGTSPAAARMGAAAPYSAAAQPIGALANADGAEAYDVAQLRLEEQKAGEPAGRQNKPN